MLEFLFPQRVRRLSFLFRHTFVCGVLYAVGDALDQGRAGTADIPAFVLYGLLLLYWLTFVAGSRCANMGFSRWCALVAFVPVLNLPFSFMLLFSRPYPQLGRTCLGDGVK